MNITKTAALKELLDEANAEWEETFGEDEKKKKKTKSLSNIDKSVRKGEYVGYYGTGIVRIRRTGKKFWETYAYGSLYTKVRTLKEMNSFLVKIANE